MCDELRHIIPSGVKCHAPALGGKPYCYLNSRLHDRTRKPAPARGELGKLPEDEEED
jgi:hypothetical protein